MWGLAALFIGFTFVGCTPCVQLCPTGIDIRKGLQNECIGWAACVDMCNSVMARMGYAPNPIRYTTANVLAQGWSRAQMLRRLHPVRTALAPPAPPAAPPAPPAPRARAPARAPLCLTPKATCYR